MRKRLFIILKADPRTKGTLLELNADKLVGEINQQIVHIMDLPREVEGERINYRLIRLGKPNLLLLTSKKFNEVDIKNGDTIILHPGDQPLKGNEFFSFESLSIAPQELSVQDLREGVRFPTYDLSKEEIEDERLLASETSSSSNEAGQQVALGSQTFEFEPLNLSIDMDNNPNMTEDDEDKPLDKSENLSKKWKKIDTSNL